MTRLICSSDVDPSSGYVVLSTAASRSSVPGTRGEIGPDASFVAGQQADVDENFMELAATGIMGWCPA